MIDAFVVESQLALLICMTPHAVNCNFVLRVKLNEFVSIIYTFQGNGLGLMLITIWTIG